MTTRRRNLIAAAGLLCACVSPAFGDVIERLAALRGATIRERVEYVSDPRNEPVFMAAQDRIAEAIANDPRFRDQEIRWVIYEVLVSNDCTAAPLSPGAVLDRLVEGAEHEPGTVRDLCLRGLSRVAPEHRAETLRRLESLAEQTTDPSARHVLTLYASYRVENEAFSRMVWRVIESGGGDGRSDMAAAQLEAAMLARMRMGRLPADLDSLREVRRDRLGSLATALLAAVYYGAAPANDREKSALDTNTVVKSLEVANDLLTRAPVVNADAVALLPMLTEVVQRRPMDDATRARMRVALVALASQDAGVLAEVSKRLR